MNYVVSDIHNDKNRFDRLLKEIDFGKDDHLFILGDLFDRCNYSPDPVGIYFKVLELDERCTLIQGNHDVWVANYILKYLNSSRRQRKYMEPYYYNSVNLILDRLPIVDAKNLAEYILDKPMQVEYEIDGTKYLFAHAMASAPDIHEKPLYYLMGASIRDDLFYTEGIEGYVSICGHTNTGAFGIYGGKYSDPTFQSIWRNDKENVIMIDCGCGYADGRLACLRLEDGKEFYIEN